MAGFEKSTSVLPIANRLVESVSFCAIIATGNLHTHALVLPGKSLGRTEQLSADPAPSEPRAYRQCGDATQVSLNVKQGKDMKRQNACDLLGFFGSRTAAAR